MQITLPCLVSVAAAARPGQAFVQTMEADLANVSLSPIKRILKLLEDMQEEAMADAKEDKAMYEKLKCWCNGNNAQKEASVAEGEARVEQLDADIASGEGSAKELQSKIESGTADLEANEASLAKASEMRKKEKAEFQTYEKEAIVNVEAMKSAIMVLEKANAQPEQSRTEQKKDAFKYNNQGHAGHGANFLQLSASHRRVGQRLGLSPSELSAVQQIVQSREDAAAAQRIVAYLQAPEYNNQSGEIFGIMKTLLDQMTSDLQAAQDKEAEAASDFKALRDSKESEIDAGEKSVDEMTDELAATKKKLADNKDDLSDTTSDLEADKNFLANLEKTCSNMEQEYAERSKVRTEESQAISETIDILTSDEAQTLTNLSQQKAASSFIQTQSQSKMAVQVARVRASRVLMRAAASSHYAPLSELALTAKSGPIDKVKEAMEKMIEKLVQEQKDEVKQKDFCKQEFHDNEMQLFDKDNTAKDLAASVSDIEGQIEEITEAVTALQTEIHESLVQLKKAGVDRVEENKDFQKSVGEADATVKILQKAAERLAQFYGIQMGKSAQPSSVEESYNDSRANADAKAPGEFKEYKKNENGGSVVALVEKFIKETIQSKEEAESEEQKAQSDYESFVHETNESVVSKSKSIVKKKELKAQAEQDLLQAKDDTKENQADLEELEKYKAELHRSCDFVVKNFDMRQAARQGEMDSIHEAIAILSGSMEG
jgi:DNA repair exonuclease SbcCD ATPase subunit